MIADLSALCYLEWRQIVNRAKRIAREPGRAIVYAVALVYLGVATTLRSGSHHGLSVEAIAEPYASAIFYAYIVLLGVLGYGAASGIAGSFSSVADARFLAGSQISERAVVAWLQLRRSSTTLLRILFTLVLYAFVFARSGTAGGIGFALLGGAVIASAAAVPMLKLRQIAGTATAQSLAGSIAAAGLLPMAIVLSGLVAPNTLRAAHGVESLGAGFAFNQLFNGDPIALAVLYAFAGALVALSFICGTGLTADLYASSMKMLNYRERTAHTYEVRYVPSPRFVFDSLRGAWTVVWKEWAAFARSPSMQRLFALGVTACAAGGAIFGSVASRSSDPLFQSIVFGGMVFNLVVIFVAMGSAVGLAGDLRKPLWWMGPDALWIRLFAWIVGTSWRLAFCIFIAIGAWALAMRVPAFAYAGVPIAMATVLYLRATGLALYALFPSSIDQRGPLAMLRALLTYALAAPPAITGLTVFVLLRSPAAGVLTGVCAGLLETALLVCFASSRIAGRGVAIAGAEAL